MTKSFNFQLIHKILYKQNEKKNRKFFYSWKFLRLKLNKKKQRQIWRIKTSKVIQNTSSGKQRTIKISKRPINKVNNSVNILSKLVRNTFYGFNWENITLSGRNYPIRITSWPNHELAASWSSSGTKWYLKLTNKSSG